jgi:hypothetical protein
LRRNVLPVVGLCLCILAADVERVGAGDEGSVAPEKTIELFNGKDLSGWYTYLRDTKFEDPRGVFTVRDRLIRISGDGYGYLSTDRAYRNYRLIVEFKWGSRNWGERIGKARDSGIFLHSRGPDGNSFDADGAYKAAIECQIMEGAVGDFLLIKGRSEENEVLEPRVATRAAAERDADNWPVFDPGGHRVTIEGFGRINWKNKDPAWEDVAGFRGARDIPSPTGQWNRVECICEGNRIQVLVNGVTVNRVEEVFPSSGHILLQCEGSEIFFRRVELQPLKSVQCVTR